MLLPCPWTKQTHTLAWNQVEEAKWTSYFYLAVLLPLILWISLELRISMPFLKRPTWPVGAFPAEEDVDACFLLFLVELKSDNRVNCSKVNLKTDYWHCTLKPTSIFRENISCHDYGDFTHLWLLDLFFFFSSCRWEEDFNAGMEAAKVWRNLLQIMFTGVSPRGSFCCRLKITCLFFHLFKLDWLVLWLINTFTIYIHAKTTSAAVSGLTGCVSSLAFCFFSFICSCRVL